MTTPLKVLWYINANDGRYPWKSPPGGEGRYPADSHRLRRLASTLDRLGFYGALLTGTPWITASSLIPFSEKLRFLIPVYPNVLPPLLLAEQARTFDWFSGGRLLFNQVNGTDSVVSQYGVELTQAERYAASAEYWTLFKRLYAGDFSPFQGKYVEFAGTSGGWQEAPLGPIQAPHTPVWGSGGVEAGIEHAGEVLDTYLTYLNHPDKLARQFTDVRAAAARHGRKVDVGVLAGVIVRETEEEAWAHAQWLLERTGAESIVRTINTRMKGREGRGGGIETLTSDDPQIQARIDALTAGRLPTREDLEIYPNLWSGVINWATIDVEGKQGRGTYLVGTPQQVADRIHELQDRLGLDTFILSAYPLIDEAERTAELLFPLLNLDQSAPALTGPLPQPARPAPQRVAAE